MRPDRRAQGFTYIETMAALALTTIALTMSLALFQHRSRHLAAVEARIHALHVIEAQIETLRSLPLAALVDRVDAPLLGVSPELGALPMGSGSVTIGAGPAGLRRVSVVVRWHDRGEERSQRGEALLDGVPLPLEEVAR